MADDEVKDQAELRRLKHRRRSYKGSVTTRIATLERLVSEGGSRTKIRFLHEKLKETFAELSTVAKDIYQLTKEFDDEDWLAVETIRVDNITAEVVDYLEARKDDAPSDNSLTESWIRSQALQNASATPSEHSQSEGDELARQLAKTDLDVMRTKGAIPKFGPPAHESELTISTTGTSGGGFGGFFGGGSVSVGNFPSTFSESALNQDPFLYEPEKFVQESSQFRFRPSALQDAVDERTRTKYPPGVPYSSPMMDMYGGTAPGSDTHPNVLMQVCHGASSSRDAEPEQHLSRSHHHRTLDRGLDAGLSNMWYTQPRMSTSAVGSSHQHQQAQPPPPPPVCQQQYQPQQTPMQQPQRQPHHAQPAATTAGFMNDVDTWIDALDSNQRHVADPTLRGITTDVTLAYLVQQGLPRAKMPYFDGSPTKWVNFITKFRDVVHLQKYLNDSQRCLQLMQQLEGPAERSVTGYTHDSRGYVLSLKRLKFLFGRKSKVAQATIRSVTQGEQIQHDDSKGLVEFYYTISDCLITLRLLNYVADLYSTETLERATSRLPKALLRKWGEKSVAIRGRGVEPNLLHLEEWLQTRVLVIQEVERPQEVPTSKSSGSRARDKSINTLQVGSCPSPSCGGRHKFWKCAIYLRLDPHHRFELVKTLKLCYNCLSNGHVLDQCTSKGTCFTKDCHDRHHTTLHKYYVPTVQPPKKPNVPADTGIAAAKGPVTNSVGNQVVPVTTMGKYSASTKKVFLQIVQVTVHAGDQSCSTFALLDNGSESTLLREDLQQKLGLKGELVDVTVGTFKDDPEFMRFYDVNFDIKSMDGKNCFKVEGGLVVPTERFHMPERPRLKECADNDYFTHLDGIHLDAVKSSDIGLLIGGDVPEALLTDDVRYGRRDQPLAVLTKFGWTLFGGASKSSSLTINKLTVRRLPPAGADASLVKFWSEGKPPAISINHASTSAPAALPEEKDDDLLLALESFWKFEQEPIADKDTAMSREDVAALQTLEKGTTLEGGRYRAPMLWKNPTVELPNNLPYALKRYRHTQKRLRADPDLLAKCQAVIDGHVRKGYARKLSVEEALAVGPRTWTLPTFPVLNINKPGKVRLVNDAAARYCGVSLNDTLLTGPDLLNSMIGVVLRFRVGLVAIAADVEEMFLRVLTTEEDSDSLRFLWQDDIHSNNHPDTYKMLSHIFGAKDSPTVANYVLKRIARDHANEFDALTFETALRSFYVDDCLKSVESVATAVSLAQQLIEMMKRGGFRLTKFISNRKEVPDALPASEVSPSVSFDIDVEKLERALGVSWNTLLDVFTFPSSIIEAPTTKRGILRVTFSIFDPVGFLAPFVLVPKLLLQLLWALGRNWDEEVDPSIATQWHRWLDGCKNLSKIQIDRCYLKDEQTPEEIQLHVFCDASEAAYGTVAYLRYSFKSGAHTTSFVMSKSRVAPTTSVTLPRLELNAAVAGVRLYRLLIRELDLPIVRICFWSDSSLTIQYIQNKQHRFKTYVANRVSEILQYTSEKQWNHVSGSVNPADILSRGVSDPCKLLEPNKENTLWFSGPAFLQQDEDCWPKLSIDSLDTGDKEIKRTSAFVSLALLHIRTAVLEAYRFSSWPKLKRVAAYCQRWIHNARCSKSGEERRSGEQLSCDELKIGELFIVKEVQRVAFSDELNTIAADRPLPKSSKLVSLSPVVDADGVLRVGGRLRKAPISPESRHQCILPSDHHVTQIIISHEHVTNGHIGPEHILANIRVRYWILNGRVAIKGVLRRCFFCQVRRAIRAYPYMADLPSGRVAYKQPPFTNCGVDVFGHLYIKQGRKRLKRWGVIFTCLTVRCIHLEIVETSDTDSFINALRRFTNRRGCPETVYSDCGSNFQGATNELDEFKSNLSGTEITQAATKMNIKWDFNPPASPHMGGAWERLIRSVKEVMTGLMNNRILTDPQLHTLFTEVENIVNSRPLTHLSDSVDDLQALTPNHILYGLHRNWGYIADTSCKDVASRKKWRQVQALRNCFWDQWRKQYLPTLTQRRKWQKTLPNLRPGQLVILEDDMQRRKNWPLARVTKVQPGDDGVVRVAEVRTKDGTYVRPVVKLLRLEDDIEVPQGEGNVNVLLQGV